MITPRFSRILCLLPIPEESIATIRVIAPLRKLCDTTDTELRVRTMHRYRPKDIAWADTIVLQRNADEFVISLMRYLQARGKRIIFEIDDLLTEVPPFLQAHEYCQKSRPYLVEALRMADALTVSTTNLRNELIIYNDRVFVVPNSMSWETTPIRHDSKPGTEVRVFIASSDTVKIDFIIRPLRRLVSESALDIRLIAIGPPGPVLQSEGIPVEVHPRLSYPDFQRLVSHTSNAIGVIPLDKSRFSRCKSIIKFIDYAAAGIPSICSAVPPYSDVIDHNQTGLLTNNGEGDWFRTIRRLAAASDERKRLATNARRFCQEKYPLIKSSHIWFELLQQTRKGQGQVGSPLIKDNRKGWDLVLSACPKAARLKTYQTLAQIVKVEGVEGLVARLSRFVWSRGDPLHYKGPDIVARRNEEHSQ